MNTNGKILNQIGLGDLNIDVLFIMMVVIIVLLIVCIITIIIQMKKIKQMNNRVDKLVMGKEGSSLEDEMASIIEDNKLLKANVTKNEEDIKILFKNSEQMFQKVGMVRYDAFQEMGGLLSFSLAILDQNNSGFILNSVHSAEGCYNYIKGIQNGNCDISLAKEEKEALDIAIQSYFN